jgi:hypothetical protein
MGTKRWLLAGQSHEGLFGEYKVKGCPYQDEEGVRGWHTKSWPVKDGLPIHDLFFDGTRFRSVCVPINGVAGKLFATQEIDERLVSVHSAEQSGIFKAIEQWEYEGICAL